MTNALFALAVALVVASAAAQSCSVATTCDACNGPACGWCNSNHKCVSGGWSGPTTGNCTDWAYSSGGSPLCLFPGPVDRCDCYCSMIGPSESPFYVGSFESDGCSDTSCVASCSQQFPDACPTWFARLQKSTCQLTVAGDIKKYLPIIIAAAAAFLVLVAIAVCCCCQACCFFHACTQLGVMCCACIPCCGRRSPEVVVVHSVNAPYAPLANPAYYVPQPGFYPQHAQHGYAPAEQPVMYGYAPTQPAAAAVYAQPPHQASYQQAAGQMLPGGNFIPPPSQTRY